jgi:hypothetical protein
MQNQPPSAPSRPLHIPLLIALVAFVAWQGFQTIELVSARSSLVAAREGQNGPIAESEQMERQLRALATGTRDLAQKGDADAKTIVDAFAKRGLTFAQPRAPAPR